MTGPARWTVDDYGDLWWEDGQMFAGLDRIHSRLQRQAHDALVADVRAARAHDTCHHTHDTLRQARDAYRAGDWDALERALGIEAEIEGTAVPVSDLLAAEGPDQTDGGTDG